MWGQIFNLENPLIGAENDWMLWTICIVSASVAIYLEQRYKWAAKLTGAIIALIFAIIFSNFGIIPMEAPTWDIIWGYVVPIAIPLLLLQCNMRKIGKETGRLLIIFLIGSIGTTCGAIIGFFALHEYIPELAGIAGMFTGSYIGGTVNLVALSATFEVSGKMVSAVTVADNILMAIYFFALIAMPSIHFFRKYYTHPYVDKVERSCANSSENKTNAADFWQKKEISLKDLAFAISTAFAIVTVSKLLSLLFSYIVPNSNTVWQMIYTLLTNLYLWITTISMLCATFAHKFFGEIKCANELGTFLIYLFFFVIGVPASVPMIISHSPLLLVFALIVVIVNMLFCLIGGKLLKFNLEDIILASNANIGGPTTAAAMAVSKGWIELIGPIMLIGTLGYVIGTYFGLIVGNILLQV